MTYRSFEYYHGNAGKHTGNDKKQWQVTVEPLRMNLVFCHQKQCANSRLVQNAQGNAEDDCSH